MLIVTYSIHLLLQSRCGAVQTNEILLECLDVEVFLVCHHLPILPD